MNRAIVIGTGFGGLATAIRLRAKGYQVTVLEKCGDAGGRARQFVRDGFRFDAGPTVMTAPYLFDELFATVGREAQDYFQMLPVDPFYRVFFDDGDRFDYVGDQERLIEQIRARNPADVDGYLKMYDHAKRIFDVGYLQLADAPFETVRDMLKVVPDMLRLENYRTVWGLVSKYIQDPKIRQVFSFHPLLVGGNPFTITSIYMLIHALERKWGVHFVKGGTAALVQALIRLLNELEVTVHLNTPVERIAVRDGRVIGVDTPNGHFPADLVVSNGDPGYTYLHLIEPRWLKKHTPARVHRKKQSMSLFVLYFGTSGEYPQLPHHGIVLGPRYRELLDDIFHKQRLADDFSLYLHAPKRTDGDYYPAGKDGFYVLSPVPNNHSGVNWQQEGERYAEKILAHLEQRLMPGLRARLETSFFVTPDYFEQELWSLQGAAFGIEPLFQQSAYFRYHNRSEDVDGLYFVGANTHPGAGVPGVLNSAKLLDHLIAAPRQPAPVPV
jgi:phytoene desaturase